MFFVNPLFNKHLPSLIEEYGIRHLHVHDLPLIKTALKHKSKIEGKIILDSHENYPELLEGWFLTKKSLFVMLKNKLLFCPSRWKKYEAKYLPKADHVITVIDEMREKFIRLYNMQEDRVHVISNYEKKEFAELAAEMSEDVEFKFEENVNYVVYVGGIGPMRGLHTVIEAMSILKEESANYQFLILGSGYPKYIEKLKQQVHDLGVEQEVKFLGYKSFSVVNYYMSKATVNIIPHVRNGHTDYTIPHKLFQIFLARSPLLVSNCKPLERIVKECDGGAVFTAEDSQSLVDELLGAISDPDGSRKKLDNAYQIAMTKYNWENESERFSEFYKQLG